MTRAEFRARLRGGLAYLGLDLSSTTDLTALVGVFPDDVGPGFDVLAQFFVPHDNIVARARKDRVPYDEWARQGFVIATPGNRVDYETVRIEVHRWADEFQVEEIAYDPWNATDLISRLQVDGLTCVPIRQGWASLNSPTKSLETAILAGWLRHDGHPVLRWCIGNAVGEIDAAGNVKLSKALSTERIDGAAALVNAKDRMDRHAEGPAEDPVLVTA